MDTRDLEVHEDRAAPITVGVKHLIDCNCILPQYLNRPKPLFHKFPVFSTITGDVVNVKYAQCPNCHAIHKVTELGKSEIMPGGKDSFSGVVSIDDVKLQLPEKIVSVLESYSADQATWEQVLFYHTSNQRPYRVILSSERIEESNEYHGKVLDVLPGDHLQISTYVRQDATKP